MKVLIISDIHANFPALEAIEKQCPPSEFDLIINCGDSIVYGPFPNETLTWLKDHNCISILGNTDKKVIKLLNNILLKKPSDPEKRIMYTWTAEQLSEESSGFLRAMKKKRTLEIQPLTSRKKGRIWLGLFHGSPARHHEFLFSSTPDRKFHELASDYPQYDIVLCGHSHSPFHKKINSTHFINPGSTGRMFDGNPRSSFATMTVSSSAVSVVHHRIDYDIEKTVSALRAHSLPEIYCTMYKLGRKTN